MPIRSDLSRQQVMTQRRFGATGTFLCITMRFVLLAIKLFAIRSDLSRQQRSESSNTCKTHYDTICPTGCQLFAIRSDLSRQRILARWRIKTTCTSLCITIRFVLLLTTIFHYDKLSYRQSSFCNTIWFVQTATVFMHYDTICSAAENSFSLRYDLFRQLPNLSVNWVNFYGFVMTHSARHKYCSNFWSNSWWFEDLLKTAFLLLIILANRHTQTTYLPLPEF